ncbi:hypothetical protein [Luteimonas sp. MC1750]|nr:hypothetical protein [Luteimonas sp. MC1750]MBJ6983692.1 hypothetical protein [Luteimonas sp. MC1750]QQO06530.1 hypothetical protein JGR68_03540 [Luteimonas sp. MC1750]
MNRLHELDAALASCQRRAIDVGELRQVWEQHCAGFQDLAPTEHEWVDVLLQKVATRHGIAGLVDQTQSDAGR